MFYTYSHTYYMFMSWSYLIQMLCCWKVWFHLVPCGDHSNHTHQTLCKVTSVSACTCHEREGTCDNIHAEVFFVRAQCMCVCACPTVNVFFRKGPPGVCSSSGLTCLFRTVERNRHTCYHDNQAWPHAHGYCKQAWTCTHTKTHRHNTFSLKKGVHMCE